ncbi:MAG: hypothetical protein LBC88_08220 [Spirochaetaceae bacterium]|jgi:hypothetical protein|nr:hypothetical protein [Spirochaetaceae bacterium]
MTLLNCHSNKYYYDHSWLNYPNESLVNDINADDVIRKKYEEEHISIWQYNINVEIIKTEYKDKYITLLQRNESIEITQEEANTISHNHFFGSNKKYYVIRALYPLPGGTYIVNLTNENNLFVYYAVMAKKDYKLKENALIIEVNNYPNNIFISFSITS